MRQRNPDLDNYGRPKAEYFAKLAAMTDPELYQECKSKIWLSAYANNNPRSDYHWQSDACYDESKKREGDIYGQAYDITVKECT